MSRSLKDWQEAEEGRQPTQKERDELMWDTKFLVEADDPVLENERQEVKDKKYKQTLMKNKQLLVMLEKERTARVKLERELREFQTVLNNKTDEDSQPRPGATDEAADWKAKSAKFEKKLQEERLKNVQLKNDLDKALRVLKKEVGDFDSLDKLLASDSWKGRAQEIEILKGKLKDYQNLNRTGPLSDKLLPKKK